MQILRSRCLNYCYKCYPISLQDDPPHSSKIKFSIMLISCSETFCGSLLLAERHTNSLVVFHDPVNIGSSNGPVLSPTNHLHLYATTTILYYLIFPRHSLFFFFTFPHLFRLLLSPKCFSLFLSTFAVLQNNIYLFNARCALIFSILVYFTLFQFLKQASCNLQKWFHNPLMDLDS